MREPLFGFLIPGAKRQRKRGTLNALLSIRSLIKPDLGKYLGCFLFAVCLKWGCRQSSVFHVETNIAQWPPTRATVWCGLKMDGVCPRGAHVPSVVMLGGDGRET